MKSSMWRSCRPRLVRDATFLEADRREIALRRGPHNRLGFAYQVAFVRVLGRFPQQTPLEIDGEILDLLIVWPHGGRTRRFVVECKVRRDGLEGTIREGVAQTRAYMDRCGAESGHLIVFDRSGDRTWEEKLFRREASPFGGPAPVTVWGM